MPEGEVQYRGLEETQQWLNDGNSQRIGLWQDQFNKYHFGEFIITRPYYYYDQIWQELVIPEDERYPIQNLRDFQIIGVDSSGLNYFYTLGPSPFGLRQLRSEDDFYVIIAILDTWTRNVIFRELPYGAWDPPRNEQGLLGLYPNAVHPNGDVYFFDADREAQEFQLKRLANDWWAELGVDQRRIGRSAENHVPLLEELGVDGPTEAHNFENEFVWVLEERHLDQLWYRIRKVSGAEGWIPADTVYWPEY